MTPRILWTLAASALLTSACSESPASPTAGRAVATPLSVLKLGSYDSTSFYVDGQLGQAWVKNTTPSAAVFMFALFDATDPNNQVDLESRNSTILQPGDSARLTVGLRVPRCKVIVVQPDVWINPPKVGPNNKYTLGELTLYGGGSTQTVSGEMDGCGILPPPPPPPPPHDPVCSVESFSLFYHTRSADWIETEHITVKPGFEGVVAYMMSWGVPGRFADFTPPLPQTRLQLVRQVLHVGENTMSVQLARPGEWPAWQMEWGCEPGPVTLVTGYEFSFLDDDFGDFQ